MIDTQAVSCQILYLDLEKDELAQLAMLLA